MHWNVGISHPYIRIQAMHILHTQRFRVNTSTSKKYATKDFIKVLVTNDIYPL